MEEKLTPEKEAELAEALEAYTNPASPEYDPEFDYAIRKAAPHWFDGEHEEVKHLDN